MQASWKSIKIKLLIESRANASSSAVEGSAEESKNPCEVSTAQVIDLEKNTLVGNSKLPRELSCNSSRNAALRKSTLSSNRRSLYNSESKIMI